MVAHRPEEHVMVSELYSAKNNYVDMFYDIVRKMENKG